eukprot:GHRQ01028505.1.p1 GENE.GHRQ01028505.1~~GHRQ01028505.1.p1  ORF type:complete len:101 (-),score=28.49 GHRQ01028505.1:1035-1337(-)
MQTLQVVEQFNQSQTCYSRLPLSQQLRAHLEKQWCSTRLAGRSFRKAAPGKPASSTNSSARNARRHLQQQHTANMAHVSTWACMLTRQATAAASEVQLQP